VPGHEGILGNERTDELAKKGADTPFTEPEPILGLPYSGVKRAMGG
jgi:Ribonuclease HI